MAVRAFSEFARRNPDAAFTLIGDGPERVHLERLAARLGHGGKVRFEGGRSHAEVLETYGNHDVLLLPSLHDSGGLAVLEAMSRGLPVICLERSGPAMTVTEDVGIKVKALNPAQNRA